jgi:HK97 family phage portal protein
MPFQRLNLQAPERRANAFENPSIPLSAAFLSIGLGSNTESNEVVNEISALGVPTVLACVRILSEGIGALPMRVYEELERGRRPAKQHYLYYLLAQEANPEMSAITFVTTMATHAVLWQNAYAEIERGADGRPIAFWPRAPWRTKPVRSNGRLMFVTTDTPNGAERQIDPANMLHIVGFSLEGLQGSSLITHARQGLGLALIAAKFGGRFYSNGARPGFLLKTDHKLSPEDVTNLRLDFEALTTGSNAWRTAVLPQGISIEPAQKDPSALDQYVATRKFEREEIAAYFRVPGYMVGAAEKALKSSIEAQNMEFLTYSLRPWLERFTQEFNRKLLPPMGRASGKFSVDFYVDALLAVDKSTRYTCYTQGRNGGWLSINDIRELEGYEPIDGGDDYLQPLNMETVTTEAEPVETDEEPVADTTSRAKQLFMPVLRDAINRLKHRAVRDSDAIRRTLQPVCLSVCSYFRSSGDPGEAETKAVDKYLSGVESRCSKWPDDPTADELNKLMKAIVFAIESDKAESRAKELLNAE